MRNPENNGHARHGQHPTPDVWRAAALRLGLKRRGKELVGPCPACGGEDRFRVTRRGGFFCRQCCPDRHAGADAMRRILEAAGLAREEEGSPSAGAPRGAAGTRSRSASRIPGVSAYPDDPERRSGAISGVRNSPDPGQEDESRPDPGGARAIWLAAETCSSEPASAYLAGRGVWPPSRPLPGAVRFIERGAAPFRLHGWPAGAVGAVVYGFARGRQLAAVQLECLDRDGVALAWRLGRSGTAKRKTLGPARGAIFRVAGTRDGDVTVMTESVIDALALSCWRGVTAWASAGAGLMPALAPILAGRSGAIEIAGQEDAVGLATAYRLQEALAAHGRGASIVLPRAGADAAEALSSSWRALQRAHGTAAAWRQIEKRRRDLE